MRLVDTGYKYLHHAMRVVQLVDFDIQCMYHVHGCPHNVDNNRGYCIAILRWCRNKTG